MKWEALRLGSEVSVDGESKFLIFFGQMYAMISLGVFFSLFWMNVL